MKKLITCLTLLTMMSAIVSCGTTDSDSEADSVKPSLPGTTVSTEISQWTLPEWYMYSTLILIVISLLLSCIALYKVSKKD